VEKYRDLTFISLKVSFKLELFNTINIRVSHSVPHTE